MSTFYFIVVSAAWLTVLISVWVNRKYMFIDTFWIYLITSFMAFTIHVDELLHVRDIHNPLLWFILHMVIANAFLLSIRKFRKLKESHQKQQEDAARGFIKLFKQSQEIDEAIFDKSNKERIGKI